MLKLDAPATIKVATQAVLDKIPVADRSSIWDGKPADEAKKVQSEIDDFKAEVMSFGMKAQGKRCVWCTLPVGEVGRRRADRDHIAPKKRYPHWTFHSKNIAIACEFCNGFSVKNDLDTISVDHQHYDSIQFKVVHPYVDDPKTHLTFTEEPVDGETGVVIKGTSDRGRWTITELKLDSPGLTVERAKELVFHRFKSKLPEDFQVLLDKATGRA